MRTEIKIYGRGGQGAKTAGQTIAEVGLEMGNYVQAFPEYGPERAGAPMNAYAKISDKPIKSFSAVRHPDVVIVIDPYFVKQCDITYGLKDDGVLIINTTETHDELQKRIKFKGKLMTLDATTIALDSLKMDKPNTVMLGALAKTGIIDLKILKKMVSEHFMNKYHNKVIAEGNEKAIQRGYDEVVLK